MRAGRLVSNIMKKCPFRGFVDCLQEECMAWSGSDCRMFMVPALFSGLTSAQGPASQPTIIAEAKSESAAQNEDVKEQEKENPLAKVTITEIKVTKNGNTRAVCTVDNGSENQVIIAKNGVGLALQKGLNKQFEIEYNLMKDGEAWFAIKAKQL